MKKITFVILDGLGDRPVAVFGNKTPLEHARTPNLDRMAREGICGIVDVLGRGVRPDSDTAHLTLFGYDLNKHYPGRGPIEAAGIGMKMRGGDILLRANLGTVDENLIIIDRRAGRIESTAPFVEELNGMKIEGVEFLLKPGTGHRAALLMRGEGLSDKISDGDPHKVGVSVQKVKPLEYSDAASFTASVLNSFLEKSHEMLKDMPINRERIKEGKLPANCLLVRGAGKYKKIPFFEEMHGLKSCCIAGAGLYKGIGKITGMDVLNVKGATGLPNTDVSAKFRAAVDALNRYEFVFVHVKPADNLGEDGNCKGKKEFIEKTDRAAGIFFEAGGIVTVTADHSTPCELKDHSGDPVPLLVYGNGRDGVEAFGERACISGRLGRMEGSEVMERIISIAREC
jgi:2,3-bisphosphoglycerate-independent phosphoglycerate mutase